MVRFIAVALAALLSGCAEMGQVLAESQQIQQQTQQRSYVNQPFTPLPSPAAVTTQTSSTNTSTDQYEMVAVNTPSGVVYKRCKLLNGRATYCI